MKRPTANELLTVPNAISAAGFGMVITGSLRADATEALTYTTVGRALDLVDGLTARALNQGSDFGAKVDATLDKLGMAAIVSGGVYHARIPKPAAAVVIAHNALNAAASITHEVRHPNEPARPSKAGKVGLFIENVGVLSYLASEAIESQWPHSRTARSLKLAGHALTICGSGLGLIAGIGYVKRAAGQHTSV